MYSTGRKKNFKPSGIIRHFLFPISLVFLFAGCTYDSTEHLIATSDIKWQIAGKYPCIHLQNLWNWDSMGFVIDTVSINTDTIYAVALGGEGEVQLTLNNYSFSSVVWADDDYYLLYLSSERVINFYPPDSIRYYYHPGVATWSDCYVGVKE